MTSIMSPSSSSLHLAGSRNKRGNTLETDETAVPDSTTIEKEMTEFTTGQDVLLKQKDGRYYLGTVVEVDCIREQCLVKFGDNTDSWSSFKDLTKLSTPEQEDLLCVICKKSAPKNKQEITVCDKCGRGYHRKCHQPQIPIECQKEGATWMCKRCVIFNSATQRLRKFDLKHEDTVQHRASSSTDVVNPNKNKILPYDINSLNWDTYHRINNEHTYCYCGENGEWYKQMLQCARCRQWFHEKCVSSLQYPLYCGDRFYVFICCLCNHGKEFLRRLEMKWVDLVHLMLFNLTAFNSKKYYDLDSIIIPYINDNWHALQLAPKVFGVSAAERRENILFVLTNNRNRFKCGREIKKRTTIWGLRVRLPPPAPTVTLSFSGIVTEEELREIWQGNRRLQILPMIKTDRKIKIVPVDAHMKNIMMGVAYQQTSNPSETDSPCPSPEMEPPQEVNFEEKLYKTNEYIGAGYVKKSVPFPTISLQRRKRLLSVNCRERTSRKPKRRNTNDGLDHSNNNRNENESGGYQTRLSLDKNNYKHIESLPLTPPTSVSTPPTPPASGSNNSLLSDLSNDFSEPCVTTSNNNNSNNKGKIKSLIDNDLNTQCCDTSGDETSSKSTLDLIIPPPKDFEGKNNPFLTLLRGSIDDQRPKKRKSKDSITLPLPLTAVIPGKPVMKPKKRQLSEKDIFIGPNGEVKRRRLRRNRSINHSVYASNANGSGVVTTSTASKTATILPARPDTKDWEQSLSSSPINNLNSNNSQINNCVDYALNGRRLRQRPDKTQQDKEKLNTSTQSTSKSSPVKQEPDIDIDDLKSSVNMYFGAANRIAAGERYTVKAKRIGPTGKVEFLIEWDGPGNGMT